MGRPLKPTDEQLPSCAYCPAPANSKEHWFPRWMGAYRGVDTLRGRICQKCDNTLGRDLDQVMSRQSPEAVNRWKLKIPGRNKSQPKNPFLYKAQVAPPTVLVADDDDRYDFVPLRGFDGEGQAPWLRQIVLRGADGRSVAIALEQDFSASWLKEAVRARGLVGAQVTNIVWEHAGKDDEPLRLPDLVMTAIAAAIPRFKDDLAAPGVRMHALDKRGDRRPGSVGISISLPTEYRRTLAKIAFHYVLMFDRFLSGREPEFDGVRAFIKDGAGNPDDFVTYHSREFVVENQDKNKKRKGPRHYLYVESDSRNQLRVYLRLFSQCDGTSGPPMRVNLGKDPYVRRLYRGHVLPIFVPRRHGFDGELIELSTGRFLGSDVAIDRLA